MTEFGAFTVRETSAPALVAAIGATAEKLARRVPGLVVTVDVDLGDREPGDVVGATLRLLGTVKGHGEYNGLRQTQVNRVKVLA